MKSLKEDVEETAEKFRSLLVIYWAVKFGLFDFLKTGRDLDAISKHFKWDRKMTFLYLESLSTLGVCRRDGDLYRCSEIAEEFFIPDSLTFVGDYLENVVDGMKKWFELGELMRRCKKVNPEPFFTGVVKCMAQECLLGELQETMRLLSSLKEVMECRKLLDLGGGHGLYAIAFTELNPDVEAVVFDLPEVVKITEEYVRRFGAKRLRVVAGNFFTDPIGSGYDIVFSSYNPGGKRKELIPKIAGALNEGGLYINKQYFRSDDENITPKDLEWNFWTFENIEKGLKAYTFEGDLTLKEYILELEESGFEVLKVFEMSSGSCMIVSKMVGGDDGSG